MEKLTTMYPILVRIVIFIATGLAGDDNPGQLIEDSLLKEDPAVLARAVGERGDAARGAAIFLQPSLNCVQCHATGDGNGDTIGPDLAKLGREATDSYLIESVLQPSKIVKKGFETIRIGTADGKVVTGLLAEDGPVRLVLSVESQAG